MLCVYLQAPFAAFRTFTAGWYRPTATFITPSAAYGLLLNVAGIETRLYEDDPKHNGSSPATLIQLGLPEVRIALGVKKLGSLAESLPKIQTIYQQLHNYLGGGSEKVADPDNPGEAITKEKLGLRRTKGAKYNITPVRREYLYNLRCYICVDSTAELEDRIRRGLLGEFNANRYGIPFLGDNQFLLDRLEVVDPEEARPAYWYEVISKASGTKPRPHTTRLTVSINRADMSRTVSHLYSPQSVAEVSVPSTAWIDIASA